MDFTDAQLAELFSGNGSEASAQEKAAALSAALRGQQRQAQQQEFMGSIGSVFANPSIAAIGNSYANQGKQNYEQAGAQLEQIAKAPAARLRMALEQQQLAKDQRENDTAAQRTTALNDAGSVTSKVRTGLAGKFGIGLPEGTAGSAIDDKELELAQKYQAGVEARAIARQRNDIARQRVADAANSVGVQLSPEALQQQTTMYLQTGIMPGFGMGKSGAAIKTAIANNAAQVQPGANLAGSKASYAANAHSLSNQQAQADLVEGKEGTALANLYLALSKAPSLLDVGSPWVNKPLRAFAAKVAGDPEQTAFTTALATAATEAAGVLRGSNTITEGARHEVETLLNPDATIGQLRAAASVLKKDMANRKTSVEGQMAKTRERMGGGGHAPAQASSAEQWARSNPDDPRSAAILARLGVAP